MSETEKKKPGPKPKSPLNKLLDAAKSLSGEERNKLEAMGLVIPYEVDPEAIEQEPNYGYYCRHCGDIALFFIGRKFKTVEGGVSDRPDLRHPVQNTPFIQPHLPRERINRHKPICQMCYQEVHHYKGRLDPRRVVEVARWRQSRDRALAQMKKHVEEGPGGGAPWKPGTHDRPPETRAFSQEYLTAEERSAIDDAADALDLNKLGRAR